MSKARKRDGFDIRPDAFRRPAPEEALIPNSRDTDDLRLFRNIEAERGVVAGMVLDNDKIDEVVLIVNANDFWHDGHQQMFTAIVDLHERSVPVDGVSLMEELTRRGVYETIGGDHFLMSVINSVPHGANTCHHAEIVKNKSIVRRLHEAAEETIADIRRLVATPEQLLDAAEGRMFAIRTHRAAKLLGPEDFLADAQQQILASQNREVSGIVTGLRTADKILGGFRGGQVVVLGARPSMGKTAFMCQVVDHASVTSSRSSLVVSLEMDGGELGIRFLTLRGKIDNDILTQGRGQTDEQARAIMEAHQDLLASNIRIDPGPTRGVGEIAAIARRHHRQYGLDFVCIDYLQLVDEPPVNGRRDDSREQAIARMSRMLKNLARELDVPIMVLCQLNRAVEARDGHRPRMSDLRESGAIEQDADKVLFLHRPEYYEPGRQDLKNLAELIIAKNRQGPTGTVNLYFHASQGRFELLDLHNGQEVTPDDFREEKPY